MKHKINLMNLSNGEKEKIDCDSTCYEICKNYDVECNQTLCNYWINDNKNNNCVFLSANNGAKTLQQIGDIFGITRMRICQIEKNALKKLCKKSKKYGY